MAASGDGNRRAATYRRSCRSKGDVAGLSAVWQWTKKGGGGGKKLKQEVWEITVSKGSESKDE